MADTDTARALEVLRSRLGCGGHAIKSADVANLVALFAAAVEEDRLYLLCKNAEQDEDCGDEHFAQLWGMYRDAQAAKRTAIAAVTKGVLGHE